jgi:hypothetical protein
MEDIVARHVASIQRTIKRQMEKSWFTPLVKLNALDETPRINFGKEPTGVEDITPSDIITTGINMGYINQPQYYEILRSIGVKINEELATKPEPKKDEETGEEDEVEEEKPKGSSENEEIGKKIKESKAVDQYFVTRIRQNR